MNYLFSESFSRYNSLLPASIKYFTRALNIGFGLFRLIHFTKW